MDQIARLKDRLIIAFHRLFRSREGLVLKNIHGSRMWLDISTGGISHQLVLDGTRENLETQVLQNALSPGDCVLDIGANIGYYALMEARIVGPTGQIYAIEPEEQNVNLLRKNVELNDYTKFVEIHQMGVSDKSGTGKLFIGSAGNLHSMVADSSDEHIEIATTTIDEFLKDRKTVDLVRMDIEGYECEAIDGMMETLRRSGHPKKMLIEVHPHFYDQNRDFVSRLAKLRELGFKPSFIVSAGIARPQEIVSCGYEPIATTTEGQLTRGLYQDVSWDHLIDFLNCPRKIVRAIFLQRD